MFEEAFKNIDDVLWKDAGCTSELDYTEQTSWLLFNTQFSAKQQLFLDFVLSHYVSVGVEELSQEKLTPLLRLKYHNYIDDAVADLGQPAQISALFTTFQKYLYQPA